MDHGLDRRAALGGLSFLTGFAATAQRAHGASAAGILTAKDAAKNLPDFTDPGINLASVIKMIGSLEAIDCPWWYTGIIYAQRGETAPVPLVRFEGCEIAHFRPWDGGYLESARTLTFFRDLETEKMIDTFANPFTGKTNRIKPNILGSDRAMHYSVNGIRFYENMDQVLDKPLRLNWYAAGDTVWLIKDRGLPSAPFQPWLEAQSATAPARQLADPAEVRADSWFSSTYLAPYLTWMEMNGEPGHVVWHACGRKLRSVDDLPDEYLSRARAEYPQQLDATPKD